MRKNHRLRKSIEQTVDGIFCVMAMVTVIILSVLFVKIVFSFYA